MYGRSQNSLTCSAPAPPCCQCRVLFEFHNTNAECHPASVHPTSEKPSIHLKPLKPKPQPRNQLYTPGRFQIPLLLNNVASDIKSTSRIHTDNTNPQPQTRLRNYKESRPNPPTHTTQLPHKETRKNHKRTTSNPDAKGNREENCGSPCA